ncbi:MAG: ankyrin repeat domain-containing protein [Proteobacteria bacterium]|nr:ankyrin repeat domain-containing protein [Pseudomonadota bacterium]
MPIKNLCDILIKGNVDNLTSFFLEPKARNIDINAIPGYVTAIHVLFFAKRPTQITRDMLQIILDLRDDNGRVRADLNKVHCNAGAALTIAVDNNDIQTVQQILDARHNDGSLAVNITAAGQHGEFWSPMTRALFKNHLEIVQFLVDARKDNGDPILSNQDLIRALQGAHANGAIEIDDNEATRWLAEHLNIPLPRRREPLEQIPQALALRPEPGEQIPQALALRPEPGEQIADVPINAVTTFIQNSQNTHKTSVTISVETSLKRLKAKYSLDKEKETLDAIKAYIRNNASSFITGRASIAIDCIDRIQKCSMRRMGSDLTARQCLLLIWQGIEDKNAHVEEVTINERDIIDRKITLVNNLVAAQTTYGKDNPACFVGTVNKIVESLDGVHPDVEIITANEILPVASEKALIFIRDALKEKTIKEQRAVLKTWNDVDDENSAAKFRQKMVFHIDMKLKEEYRTLLTEEQRVQITNNIEYAPKPVLHRKLEELIENIATFDANAFANQKLLIEKIQEQAKQAYDERDNTFQVEYDLLLSEKKALLQKIMDDISLGLNEFKNRMDKEYRFNLIKRYSIHSFIQNLKPLLEKELKGSLSLNEALRAKLVHIAKHKATEIFIGDSQLLKKITNVLMVIFFPIGVIVASIKKYNTGNFFFSTAPTPTTRGQEAEIVFNNFLPKLSG